MRDYQLFPIPIGDINRPVYYMVKSLVYGCAGHAPADNSDLEAEWFRLKVNTWIRDYLVFPSEDSSQRYDSDTLQQEVIILRDCTKRQRESITPESTSSTPEDTEDWDDPDIGIFGIDFSQYDTDEYEEVKYIVEPHEEHYYIDVSPDTGDYRLVKKTDTFDFQPDPQFPANTPQLIEAIDQLLPVLQETAPTTSRWAERLATTRDMLNALANELHILHNGGLYDWHVLERLLSEANDDIFYWHPLLSEYVRQLKRFAMYAVRLDWKDL